MLSRLYSPWLQDDLLHCEPCQSSACEHVQAGIAAGVHASDPRLPRALGWPITLVDVHAAYRSGSGPCPVVVLLWSTVIGLWVTEIGQQ